MPLTARGLGHRFSDGPYLFRGVDFDLRAGALVALTGPSGSGKSTLLSIMAGWTTPAEGTVARPGVSTTCCTFQSAHGVARRTAIDHVVLPLIARGFPRRASEHAARPLLERFALDHVATSLYSQLSGGEAQRLMLARALASAPDLTLIDEPTAQLDPANARSVIDVLGGLASSGGIVVIATHDDRVRTACSAELALSAASA
jgi:lipoprotein-releasing system ATP-binding protein